MQFKKRKSIPTPWKVIKNSKLSVEGVESQNVRSKLSQAKVEFPGGRGVQNPNPSVGLEVVWMFSETSRFRGPAVFDIKHT